MELNNEVKATEEAPLISAKTITKIFRIVGWIEGASLLALFFIAMPIKYILGIPEATKLAGSIHGFLFIAYILLAFQTASALKWPKKILTNAILGAIVPFGTFIFDKKYLTQKQPTAL